MAIGIVRPLRLRRAYKKSSAYQYDILPMYSILIVDLEMKVKHVGEFGLKLVRDRTSSTSIWVQKLAFLGPAVCS